MLGKPSKFGTIAGSFPFFRLDRSQKTIPTKG